MGTVKPTPLYTVGDIVEFIDHPLYSAPSRYLIGEQGTIVDSYLYRGTRIYKVKVPWANRVFECVPDILKVVLHYAP